MVRVGGKKIRKAHEAGARTVRPVFLYPARLVEERASAVDGEHTIAIVLFAIERVEKHAVGGEKRLAFMLDDFDAHRDTRRRQGLRAYQHLAFGREGQRILRSISE